jgi:hypothetical protein
VSTLEREAVSIDEKIEAAEIARAITDLARVIGQTAVERKRSAEYAPVLGHLIKARRALRAAYDM